MTTLERRMEEGASPGIQAVDLCPYCIDEIRRGIPEDGKCGHEHLRAIKDKDNG